MILSTHAGTCVWRLSLYLFLNFTRKRGINDVKQNIRNDILHSRYDMIGLAGQAIQRIHIW